MSHNNSNDSNDANNTTANSNENPVLSPLQVVASQGRVDEIRRLAAANADPNEFASTGATALMQACANGHLDAVVALLSNAKANVNAVHSNPRTRTDDARVNDKTPRTQGGHQSNGEAMQSTSRR